ncbi:hypothetical protein AMS62_05005 [Bacillus sp. FJAT-18019]|nr:hypothetical protein AMS62_05005 [Bacillus sp. FJAT-18019]
MKLNKLFPLMLVLAMFLTTSVFAADNGTESTRIKDSAQIDFSVEGSNVSVLTVETGELEAYDENGNKTTTLLSKVQVAQKLAELKEASHDQIGTMSYNTGEINMTVPKNINGNQGAVVGGSYRLVSPHTYVNLHVVSLPQTTMPSINVSFSNEFGDDAGWLANIQQGQIVWMTAKYPNEYYAAKVSTNEANSSTARLRSYTD